jgi:hypothetical protein
MVSDQIAVMNRLGAVGFAGHFPLVLPDEFPLAGYLLIVQGIVIKSNDASAILTGAIGEKAFAQEWPRTGGIVEAGGKSEPQIDNQKFAIPCFTVDEHRAVGQPRRFPPAPPLTLSLGMEARRSSVDASIAMQVERLDILILR